MSSLDIPEQELADKLDMSRQNPSELLRRGTEKLFDKSLGPAADIDKP